MSGEDDAAGSGGSTGSLDLVALAQRHGFELKVASRESVEERRSRLGREEAEHAAKLDEDKAETAHRRRIFWVIFLVVILAGTVAFGMVLLGRPDNAETQAWARTIASAVVGGVVGYFTAVAGPGAK